MKKLSSLRRSVNTFLVSLFLTSTAVAVVDLEFDVDFPSFTGIDATIEVNGEPCEISVRIAPDEKGKYACVPGQCLVNGVEVIAKGSLKPKRGADGFNYFYTISLKSPPGAVQKVAVKMRGEISSGEADFKYKGPLGKASIPGQAVDILANLGLKIGRVSISPELLDPAKPGKLGGTGTIATGLGNDSDAEGPLKVKITPTSISIALKVGKRKLKFKAKLEGGSWVGTLKVTAKPLKLTTPYSIPAEGELAPVVPNPGGGRCSESDSAARQGLNIFTIDMLIQQTFTAGSIDVLRSPAGNVFLLASIPPDLDSHWFAEINCAPLELAPTEPGPWYCTNINRYEFGSGRRLARGRLCLTLTEVEPLLRGTWSIESESGLSGTFTVQGSACGQPLLDASLLELTLLDPDGVNVGSISTVATAEGRTQVDGSLQGAQGIWTVLACSSAAARPEASGEWLRAKVWDRLFETPSTLIGNLALTVDSLSPYFEGAWTLDGSQPLTGRWISTAPICGQATANVLFAGLVKAEESIGTLSIDRTELGSAAIDLDLVVGERQLGARIPCVDVDLDTTTPGEWFRVSIVEFDFGAGTEEPAGSISVTIESFSPRGGSFTVFDLEGVEIEGGTWSEN